jgi:hypothetical protein
LVTPEGPSGDITTFELRSDNSRFIAELDDEGRITGGRFQ